VARNRIKRRLRALVRELVPQHGVPGMDYVLIARAEAAAKLCEDDFPALRSALQEALLRARKS
jgi:ribonuclease P protein component